MTAWIMDHAAELLWSVTVGGVGIALRIFWKKIRATNNGLQCILRQQLIDQHDKWTTRGYCPIWARDVWAKAYRAYHDLGGNSVVDDMDKDIWALPDSDPMR